MPAESEGYGMSELRLESDEISAAIYGAVLDAGVPASVRSEVAALLGSLKATEWTRGLYAGGGE